MPDGQIFTPRNPYDATLVYNKADDGRDVAQEIYLNEITKNPLEDCGFFNNYLSNMSN